MLQQVGAKSERDQQQSLLNIFNLLSSAHQEMQQLSSVRSSNNDNVSEEKQLVIASLAMANAVVSLLQEQHVETSSFVTTATRQRHQPLELCDSDGITNVAEAIVPLSKETCAGTYWRTEAMFESDVKIDAIGRKRQTRKRKSFFVTVCKNSIKKIRRGPPCLGNSDGLIICSTCYGKRIKDEKCKKIKPVV